MIAITLALALTPVLGEFNCGTKVVSGTGKTVALYARTGEKVVELPVKDNNLAEELPIVTCGTTMVLVRYHDQTLRADMWQVVTDQTLELICTKNAGGDIEQRSSAKTMNGLTTMACSHTATAAAGPTPAAAPAKRKLRK